MIDSGINVDKLINTLQKFPKHLAFIDISLIPY